VPSIPFLDTHSVGVELLVEVIQKANGLDNHGVNFVGGELELVTCERVGQTKGHGGHVTGHQTGNESGEVLTDGTVDVVGRGVGNELDVEARKLANGIAFRRQR
jgi:hypothetical protein